MKTNATTVTMTIEEARALYALAMQTDADTAEQHGYLAEWEAAQSAITRLEALGFGALQV